MGWKKKVLCIIFLSSYFLVDYIYNASNIFSSKENTKIEDSSSANEILKLPLNEKFIEWFVGLCEAESNFLIRKRKNQDEVIGFEFVFRIVLHIDDTKVLEFIKNTLNCGRLSIDRDTCVFTISKISDIETILLPIFETFSLNSVKYLDYLDFKNAFLMYTNRIKIGAGAKNLKLINNILNIIENMNSKRKNYDLSKDHVIKITANYLIGYLEGDGTFYLNKSDMTVHIGLVSITANRLVLEKIREFLLNLLDEHSYILGSSTKLINIVDKEVKGNNKAVSILDITQIDFICNILIPYFDNIEFRTKKYLDYLDLKTIAHLLLDGKHLTENGKNLIIKLGDTMNNSRLSTNPSSIILDEQTKLELEKLINSEALIHIDEEGRVKIIAEKKYIRSTYIIKTEYLNGTITYFTNGVSCAKSLHISNNTVTARLNDGKPVKNKDGVIVALFLKRLRAYSPKSIT